MLYIGVNKELWDSQRVRVRSGEQKRKVRRKNKSKGERETMHTWSEGKEREERQKKRWGRGEEGEERERENIGEHSHHGKNGKFKGRRKLGLAQVMRTFERENKQELLSDMC